MRYSRTNPKIGLAVIVEKEGKILVGWDDYKKKYAFPGGNWEGAGKETLEEGAIREVFEETGGTQKKKGIGLKCKNLQKLYEYTFYRKDTKTWYKSVGFIAQISSGVPGDDPIEKRTNWQFVTPQEALKLDLFEPARNGVLEYMKNVM